MNKKVIKRGLLPYLFLFIFLIGIMMVFSTMNREAHEFTYNKFKSKTF